jgi:hypothetical protein
VRGIIELRRLLLPLERQGVSDSVDECWKGVGGGLE